MRRAALLAASLAAVVTSASSVARADDTDFADEPATATRSDRHQPFVLGVFLGYGTASLDTGMGLRIGYVARSRVYIGGAFHYHFGESVDQGAGGFKTTTGVTYFIHNFEMGYAGKAGPVEIRPYFGLGPAFGYTSRDGYTAAPTRSHGTAALSPGLAIAVDIGEHTYLGIDGRAIFFVQTTIPQAAFGGVAGARF